MEVPFRYLRFWLAQAGLLPKGRLAHVAWYLLGLDVLLFVTQKLLVLSNISYASVLSGWVSFLSFVVIVLFLVLAVAWLKARLLWRLRNRLVVTYVFIGVIPVVLLLTLGSGTLYLLAGQFANFVVTSELQSHMRSLGASNAAIASELAARLSKGEPATAASLEGLQRRDAAWGARKVCAWENNSPLPVCGGERNNTPFALASFPEFRSGAIIRDKGKLYLRCGEMLQINTGKLTVTTSEALEHGLLEKIAEDLGEVTLYAGIELGRNIAGRGTEGLEPKDRESELRSTLAAGSLPHPVGLLDREITFATPVPILDWPSGKQAGTGLLRVQTRPSLLYARLFAALGDWAGAVEYLLFFVAIFFAIIEIFALWIGTRLTRSITGAVAQLYTATQHVNRGDLSHRITVKSNDQLAALAHSFNSMMASLENLLEEQKERQRLQNELIIAQEVQAQLFPKEISQMATLEVHGFCRPARTVSGDYYDFLAVGPQRMVLAVGDVSGKGISAALLMATIHSAVRAYSLEGIPAMRELLSVGARTGAGQVLAGIQGAGVSPGTLLSLLNQQLYESTPSEKYATLFLASYDGNRRILTYSNGGHLPPLILSEDGRVRRLDRGGMVVGLFASQSYEEASVQLRGGEIFLAYSDGVTEPENDYGEFGEQRLIDLVQENRHLPLTRISEIVTAAVDDWIGANEQPDDVTLVLARPR